MTLNPNHVLKENDVKSALDKPRVPSRQVASLEAACDRYRLQEEEWQNKLGQSDGQARVILVMSEQVSLKPTP